MLTNGVKDIVEQNSNNNKALVCSDVSYTWKAGKRSSLIQIKKLTNLFKIYRGSI